MHLRLLVITAGSLAMTACAPVQGPGATASEPSQCIFQNDIRNFRVSRDEREVYVRGLNRTVYRLSVTGPCPDLDRTPGIAFAPLGGVSRLCPGGHTRLVIGGSPSPVLCNVRMIGALTEAEVAALPERDRP